METDHSDGSDGFDGSVGSDGDKVVAEVYTYFDGEYGCTGGSGITEMHVCHPNGKYFFNHDSYEEIGDFPFFLLYVAEGTCCNGRYSLEVFTTKEDADTAEQDAYDMYGNPHTDIFEVESLEDIVWISGVVGAELHLHLPKEEKDCASLNETDTN